MAANVFSWFPTHQADNFDFADVLPTYAVFDSLDKPDEPDRNGQTLLTAQSLIVARQEDAHRHHLAKKADASSSIFLYNKFGILSGRTRMNEAIKKFEL